MKEEYRELTLKEKLLQANEHAKILKKKIDNLQDDAMRYRRLRQLEVVIMAEDGAKYLKGKDLDGYIDDLPARTLTSAQFTKVAKTALNQVFAEEYDRYKAEVMENVKA